MQRVARLVAILRHAWTDEGVVAWFYRPRKDLDARKPIELIDEPPTKRSSCERHAPGECRVAADPLALLPAAPPAELIAFRYANYDTPFWVRSNTLEGRWNLAGEAPTQYWALSSDAAWAELMRSEDLAHRGGPRVVRMPIWACRIGASLLVDFNDQRRRDEFAISEEALVSDDWAVPTARPGCRCSSWG